MIVAGVDVGSQRIKAVILQDEEILSHAVCDLGVDINKSAQEALKQALDKAGLKREDVGRIITTGAGAKDVPFGDDTFSTIYCDAVGTTRLFPRAASVIDLGYEECRVLKCSADGKVIHSEMNEKCAAGAGAFLELIAKALGVPMAEAGDVSLQSRKDIPLTTVCAVFGESEAVSLIHKGETVSDVLHAVYGAVASKTYALLQKILPDADNDVVLIGGAARNVGFVDAFRSSLNGNLVIPEDPDIVSALGAAVLATNIKEEG
jgi:benzoyl-CoA reductase subunit D